MQDKAWSPRLNPDVKLTVIDDEAVLFDRENERVHQLDAVGTSMLLACDGARSVDDIVTLLIERYDVEESRLHADTADLLARLRALGILV